MRKRLLLFLVIPQKTNRWKSLIVGPSISLFTSMKREKKKRSFLHRLVVMATILEKMAGHNKTPTILRNHEEMRKMSLQRLCACWRQQQVQSNGDEEDLVRNILTRMVDDNNCPLPKNIPTEGEENEGNNMQFFSEWEHSGSCYHCLEGGCKNKARINFNTYVKQTIQQLLEIFFSNHLLLEQSSHR